MERMKSLMILLLRGVFKCFYVCVCVRVCVREREDKKRAILDILHDP